jgi:hypothetical protein
MPFSTQKSRGFHSSHAVYAVVTLGVGGWQLGSALAYFLFFFCLQVVRVK